MLIIKVDTVNEKVYLDALNRHPEAAFAAVGRAMARIGKGVYNASTAWLEGSRQNTGGFPVPQDKGHLRRSLNWLAPGESKSVDGQSIRAGELESIVYNTARYGSVIAKGTHSSAKFGPRDYLKAGIEDFSVNDKTSRILDDELSKEWLT